MKNPNRKIVISMRIHPVVAERVAEAARRLNFSRSKVLNECVFRALAQIEARFTGRPGGTSKDEAASDEHNPF